MMADPKYTPSEKAGLASVLAQLFPYTENTFYYLLGYGTYDAVKAVADLARVNGIGDLVGFYDKSIRRATEKARTKYKYIITSDNKMPAPDDPGWVDADDLPTEWEGLGPVYRWVKDVEEE